MDRGTRFFSVARSIVEDIPVGRVVSQQAGSGKSTEEQHFPLKRIGQRDDSRGSAHVADNSKNLLFLIEMFHRYGRSRSLIAVISCNKPELPPENSTRCVRRIERRFDAQPHVLSELFGCAAERRRNTETDFAVGHPTKDIFRGPGFWCKRLRGSREYCLLLRRDRLHRPLCGGKLLRLRNG